MSKKLKVKQVISNPENTTIELIYTNLFNGESWANINPETFIRIKGNEQLLKLQKSIGMPLGPERIQLQKKYEVLTFKLIFPTLPEGTTHFDIIENEEDEEAFNLFNVSVLQEEKRYACNKSAILKNIENIALEIKNRGKNTTGFFTEIENIKSMVLDTSEFLGLSNEETTMFCYLFYNTVCNERFSLNEMKKTTEYNPFDFFEIKNLLIELEKKGWIKKTSKPFSYNSKPRSEEVTYTVPANITSSLYKNEKPVIEYKAPDALFISGQLLRCFSERMFSDADETLVLVDELENEYIDVAPFSIAESLSLEKWERHILYYIITKTYNNEAPVSMEKMMQTLYDFHFERFKTEQNLIKQKGKLFEHKLIEFVSEELRSEKRLQLTEECIKQIFGEESFLLKETSEVVSRHFKLIKHEDIVEKEMYYNQEEKKSMSLLNQFLSDENYTTITKRLKENKMKPGMTVLLYGHPGTGKTESVYQLAKRSKRNIVQVNISEIKDMWVGESEKNIKAIFDNYRKYSRKSQNMPMLLFNESDALIGKRYNVTHSVDQMNNSMQNILLQELEDFHGILIATTNLLCNLDEAFERRFLYKVKFLKPDLEAKKYLWKEKLNFLNDEACEQLASEFDFSGGQIDNISKKVFLDALLRNYEPQLQDVIDCCSTESLSNRSGKNIGFSSLSRNSKQEDSEF